MGLLPPIVEGTKCTFQKKPKPARKVLHIGSGKDGKAGRGKEVGDIPQKR
jgi:hypothetical protein